MRRSPGDNFLDEENIDPEDVDPGEKTIFIVRVLEQAELYEEMHSKLEPLIEDHA